MRGEIFIARLCLSISESSIIFRSPTSAANIVTSICLFVNFIISMAFPVDLTPNPPYRMLRDLPQGEGICCFWNGSVSGHTVFGHHHGGAMSYEEIMEF